MFSQNFGDIKPVQERIGRLDKSDAFVQKNVNGADCVSDLLHSVYLLYRYGWISVKPQTIVSAVSEAIYSAQRRKQNWDREVDCERSR